METRTWADIKVDSYIKPDGWRFGARLLPSEWDRATFRLPSSLGYDLAVNVEVTGRTHRKVAGEYMVRVRVTFVGDGEPDMVVGGWTPVQW